MQCPACKHNGSYEENEPFQEVEGHFTMTEEHDYRQSRKIDVTLFACPKCKNVILGY